MTNEKIYKSLTKNELGILKGTEVDKVDGKIFYLLEILEDGQPVELRRVAQSTFKRWWRLVEDVTFTAEDETEEVTVEEQVEPQEQPTIEDLKKFNEAGGELTEEELQVFTQEAAKISTMEQVIEEQEQVEQQIEEESKQPKQPKPRKIEGATLILKEMVEQKGGEFHLYSEGRKGVVKTKGKSVLFFGLRRNGAVRLFMKEELDDVLECNLNMVKTNSYPTQFPYRLDIKTADDSVKELLDNILNLYI